LTSINQKTAKVRCTTCKRRRGVAIAEQVSKGEPCPPVGCEFAEEIASEIENRNRFAIIPKERKRIDITEKESPKINFTKRK
jgi:hypothetical protein